jgi:prophage regulatory protein
VATERRRYVGTHEIRGMLGNITRGRVYFVINQPGFPAPIAVLTQGKVWRTQDIENWMAEHHWTP